MSTELSYTLDSFMGIQQRFVDFTDKDTFQKECSFAMQLLNKSKQLAKCDQGSVLESVLNIAQIGLTLNPALKLAYLVPRWDSFKGKMICCLEPSYQGLVKLITDSGSATSVYCYPVFKGDEFTETLGTSVEIIHKPKRQSKEIELVYAVSVLHDGTKHVEVMTIEEIESIRDKSESYKAFKAKKIKSCVWDTWFTEMARKTVIRRLVKYLPKTDRWDKLASAVQLDETDYSASMNQISFIESLMMGANLTDEELSDIYREIQTDISSDRAGELIKYLKDNQVNPVTHGGSPSATDVKEHVDIIT